MDDYISKPVKLPELQSALRRRTAAAEAAAAGAEEVSEAGKGSPGVDFGTLERLRELSTPADEDVVGQLIEAFLEGVPRQLISIGDAVSPADATALQARLAPFQSSCRILGARRLEELCTVLSEQVEQGDAGASQETLGALKAEFRLAEQELTRFLAKAA